jgi:HK97 family phage major capsid protein
MINTRIAALNTKAKRGQRLSASEVRELSSLARMAVPHIKRAVADNKTREARFTAWLSNPGHELRAMGTASGSAGGDLIPPGWYGTLLHFAREFSGIAAGFGTFETTYGQATVQPSYSAYNAASVTAEGDTVADGPYPVIGQRAWPEAPIYTASAIVGMQLVQDYGAEGTYSQFVQRALAEALGRKLAVDAASVVYSAVGSSATTVNLTAAKALALDSGATTELAANGLTIQTYAAMWRALDPFYKPTAEWRMNSAQAEALSRTVDPQGRYVIDPSTGIATLFNRPIRETNSVSDLAVSAASGPVLLSPEFAFTQRVVIGDATFLASNEARAEFFEMYYRAILRTSFMAADPAACVGVKAAAS